MSEPTGPRNERPKDDHKGIIFGPLFGTMVGLVVFALTDEILWLAYCIPLGLLLGIIVDGLRRRPKR